MMRNHCSPELFVASNKDDATQNIPRCSRIVDAAKLALRIFSTFLLLQISSLSIAGGDVITEVVQTRWYISSSHRPASINSNSFRTFDEFKSEFNSFFQNKYRECKEAVEAYNNLNDIDSSPYACSTLRITGKTPVEGRALINGQPTIFDIDGAIDMDTNISGVEGTDHLRVGYAQKIFACPKSMSNLSKDGQSLCRQEFPSENHPDECPSPLYGNPINASNGSKNHHNTDYSNAAGTLSVERRYLNQRQGWSTNGIPTLSDLESTENRDYCEYHSHIDYVAYDWTKEENVDLRKTVCLKYVKPHDSEYSVYITLENGSILRFKKDVSGDYVAENPKNGHITKMTSEGESSAIWKYVGRTGEQLYFDGNGFMIKKVDSKGRTTRYEYDNGFLSRVADESGRDLEYSYNEHNKVSRIKLPGGEEINYIYDASSVEGLLSEVVWPDGSSRQFLYNEPGLVPSSQKESLVALTGIVDEVGNRIGTYQYDSQGRAVSTEGGLGEKKYTFSGFEAETHITYPFGKTYSLEFEDLQNGSRVITSSSQPSGSGCLASTKDLSYTEQGLVEKKVEFNGSTTLYDYDEITGLESTRVEGVTDPASSNLLVDGVALPDEARKISTRWTTALRKRVEVAKPGAIESFVYNGSPDPFNNYETANCSSSSLPLLCRKVVVPTEDKNGALGFSSDPDPDVASREWFYTYNAAGQVLTESRVKNEEPDVARVYYESSGDDWRKGDLKGIKNRLGYETRFDKYDPHGRILLMTDHNGVESKFTYDLRGRLTSQTVDDRVTLYSYDVRGNRTSAVLPDGSTISYHYDLASRLIKVIHSSGDTVTYQYDVDNNITLEQKADASGAIYQSREYIYDDLSRLQSTIGGEGQKVTYLYDASGNLTGTKNAKQHTTQHSYDTLNRRSETSDALTQITDYSHDAQGNLTEVIDPKGLTTQYTYNAFGELIRQESPDTGVTLFEYNDRGNLVSRTDARGIEANYRYDALDRPTHIEYGEDSAENITLSYDDTTGSNAGIGRLTSVNDASGNTRYHYNALGQVAEKQVTVAGTSLNLQYQYDALGQLSGITYPSGRQVHYERDNHGQIKRVLTQASQQDPIQTLMEEASYLPFGPVSEFVSGNELRTQLSYDLDYRLTKIEVGDADPLLSRLYEYDAVNNITRIANDQEPGDEENFTYDPLDRLTDVLHPDGLLSYTYDPVGNRTKLYRDGGVESYLYGTDSHRLQSRNDTQYQYDAVGNTLNNGLYTFQYSASNRLTGVENSNGFVAEYRHNALGQRVYKRIAANNTPQDNPVTLYLYNETGQLIGEYDDTGTPIREYIYREQEPLALATSNQIYYYHNDHLATPKLLTDAAQNIVWQAKHTPFGKAEIQTEQVTNNLRFPGQYYDAETGLHYNYFRDYDPETGRYLQSDPIGLEGGINTYAYVGGNPLSFVDPLGLARWQGRIESISYGRFGYGGTKGQIILKSDCVDGKQWYVWAKFSGHGGSAGPVVSASASRIELNDPHESADPISLTGNFTMASSGFSTPIGGVTASMIQAGMARSDGLSFSIGLSMGWEDVHGSIDIEKAKELPCECE